MSWVVGPQQKHIILVWEVIKHKDLMVLRYLRCTIYEKSNGTQDAFSGAISNKSIHLCQYCHALCAAENVGL
jgi:hypothetical protein